jgi:hypothetical protein
VDRDAPTSGDELASPNALGAVTVSAPDFMRDPPWSTRATITRPGAPPLRLELLQHANVTPQVRWINDELLFVQVWWGRIVGTDLVIDVPGARVIYRRMFVYGPLGPTGGTREEGAGGLGLRLVWQLDRVAAAFELAASQPPPAVALEPFLPSAAALLARPAEEAACTTRFHPAPPWCRGRRESTTSAAAGRSALRSAGGWRTGCGRSRV